MVISGGVMVMMWIGLGLDEMRAEGLKRTRTFIVEMLRPW